MIEPQSDHIKKCIETCWTCRTECERTLFNHCIETGADHIDPDHLRLMADCIQICQAAADSMVRNSPVHAAICAACAVVCEETGRSCEQIEEPEMQNLARLCHECADVCRAMAVVNPDINYGVERHTVM